MTGFNPFASEPEFRRSPSHRQACGLLLVEKEVPKEHFIGNWRSVPLADANGTERQLPMKA